MLHLVFGGFSKEFYLRPGYFELILSVKISLEVVLLVKIGLQVNVLISFLIYHGESFFGLLDIFVVGMRLTGVFE